MVLEHNLQIYSKAQYLARVTCESQAQRSPASQIKVLDRHTLAAASDSHMKDLKIMLSTMKGQAKNVACLYMYSIHMLYGWFSQFK